MLIVIVATIPITRRKPNSKTLAGASSRTYNFAPYAALIEKIG
jgi:hypothetical protein